MKLQKGILLAAFSMFAASAMAQTNGAQATADEGKGKYEFQPHWFIQAQAGVAETRGEIDWTELLSPAAQLSFGYRFTPIVGLRIGGSAWQAKGSYVPAKESYKYKYMQGNVDVMFDLSAAFCKYNPKRVFNVYAFAGAGVNYAFDNDEAVDLANAGYRMAYLWNDHRVSPVGRAGLGINLRLADHVAFNIEGNANILSDHFNSKKADNPDWQFNLLAGFTFSLGKTYKVREVPVVPTPVQPEPEKEQVIAPAPAPEPVKKVEEKAPMMTQNVFFVINSSKVSKAEEAKVDQLVSFMKANPDTHVTVTGYADAATGSKKYNAQISQWRAEAVSKMLQSKGISSSRITVDSKGDTVQPFSVVEENRVSICVAKQ